jgi:hypothetical protein
MVAWCRVGLDTVPVSVDAVLVVGAAFVIGFRDALTLAHTPKKSMNIALRKVDGVYGDTVEGGSRGNGPCGANLRLEVRNEDVIDEFVSEGAGEDGVDEVFGDGGLVFHIEGEERGFDADVGDIVELGDNVVPVVRTCVAICLVYLGTEVSEEKDGGVVWSNKDGPDEHFEIFHHVFVTREQLIST